MFSHKNVDSSTPFSQNVTSASKLNKSHLREYKKTHTCRSDAFCLPVRYIKTAYVPSYILLVVFFLQVIFDSMVFRKLIGNKKSSF